MTTVHLCGEPLPHPGHVCAFFDSRQAKYDVLIPFLKDAILAGDVVVNIVDESERPAHLETLARGGVPVREAMTIGQLDVLTSEATYLQPGENVLPRLLEFLRARLLRAREDDRCVRTAGEMSWIGRSDLPVEDVLEYEARVNELVPDFECSLLCIYDLAQTPSTLMMDILATHPFAILQGRLWKNPFYVEADEYLRMLRQRRMTESPAN